MIRAWTLSFLVVAIAVGAILWFTRDDEPTKQQSQPDSQPTTRAQTLTNNDVLKYLEVWPKIDAVLIASAQSGNASPTATRDAIREVLALHALSEESWDQLWRTLEDAVNGVRAEQENPMRLAKIDRRIAIKQEAIAAADGALKDQLGKDLAILQAERDRYIKPVHPTDREVLMRYWDQLNSIVPRLRPN